MLLSQGRGFALLSGVLCGMMHAYGFLPFATLSPDTGRKMDRSSLMSPFSSHPSKQFVFSPPCKEFIPVDECNERQISGEQPQPRFPMFPMPGGAHPGAPQGQRQQQEQRESSAAHGGPLNRGGAS